MPDGQHAAAGSSARKQRALEVSVVTRTRCYQCFAPRKGKRDTRFDQPPRRVTALMALGNPLLADGVALNAIICTVCRRAAEKSAAARSAAAESLLALHLQQPSVNTAPRTATGTTLQPAAAPTTPIARVDSLCVGQRRSRSRSASPPVDAGACSAADEHSASRGRAAKRSKPDANADVDRQPRANRGSAQPKFAEAQRPAAAALAATVAADAAPRAESAAAARAPGAAATAAAAPPVVAAKITKKRQNRAPATIGNGVSVRPSTLGAVACNGLFADRPFPRNSLISEYDGRFVKWEEARELERTGDDTHLRKIEGCHCAIDGRHVPNEPGRGGASFANDPRDDRVNAMFVIIHRDGMRGVERLGGDNTKRVFLKATKDIKPGDEVFVSYARSYWDRHAHRLADTKRAPEPAPGAAPGAAGARSGSDGPAMAGQSAVTQQRTAPRAAAAAAALAAVKAAAAGGDANGDGARQAAAPTSVGAVVLAAANAHVVQMEPQQTLRHALDAARAKLDACGGIVVRWPSDSSPPPSHAVVQQMVESFRADQSGVLLSSAEVLFAEHKWTRRVDGGDIDCGLSARDYESRGAVLRAAVGDLSPSAVLDGVAAQMNGSGGCWPSSTYMNGMQVSALSALHQRAASARAVPRRAAPNVTPKPVTDNCLSAMDRRAGARSCTTLHADAPDTAETLAGALQPTVFISAGPALFGTHTEPAGADGIIQYVSGSPKFVFSVPRRHSEPFQHYLLHERAFSIAPPDGGDRKTASGLCFIPTAEELKRFDIAVLQIDEHNPICVVGRWCWHWGVCTGPSVTLNCNVYSSDTGDAARQALQYLFHHRLALWQELCNGPRTDADWEHYVRHVQHLQLYHNSAVGGCGDYAFRDDAVLPTHRPKNMSPAALERLLVPASLRAAYRLWRAGGLAAVENDCDVA